MLEKPVRKDCPTWDWTEFSDPMLNTFVLLVCLAEHWKILPDAMLDKITHWTNCSTILKPLKTLEQDLTTP
jgi:hypothetical protein